MEQYCLLYPTIGRHDPQYPYAVWEDKIVRA